MSEQIAMETIAVIGLGYVGLTTAVGFAAQGKRVIAVSRRAEQTEAVNAGRCPIYEPGMEQALHEAVAASRLQATTDLAGAVQQAGFVFICVGTPSRHDGSIDLADVRQASLQIGAALKSVAGSPVIVVKSTVVPGTTATLVVPAIQSASGKTAGQDFGVCMNPEFLREGKAMEDVLQPDRVVIGQHAEQAGAALEQLSRSVSPAAPILRTTLETAEMIKYASNAFLATKVSFINEVGNICKHFGIDTYAVAEGMGLDKRIGPHFLQAGVGFGGSCFPKDVSALIALSQKTGYHPKLLEEVVALNKRQRQRLVAMLRNKLGEMLGKRVAVLGLAFKADTDDIRESPATDIIADVKRMGATIRAYDPQAAANMRKIHPDITYCSSAAEALQGADACLVLTDWDEFRRLTPVDFKMMRRPLIIEGRRVLDRQIPADGICW